MTHPENPESDPLWTESRVEILLEDFFRKEMPAALREPIPSRRQFPVIPARTATPRRSRKPRANSFAGYCMVGFTSILMLMVAFLAWNDAGLNPHGPAAGSQIQPQADDSGSLSNREVPAESERALPIGKGPVEMRPRTRPVGTEAPFPPPGEKPAFPELEIEVYPLDREAPAQAEPSESRRQDSPRPFIPFESRQLPESHPTTDPFDPDEAALEPVLPEIRGF